MAAFPPDWDVDDIDDYESFHLGPAEDQELCARLLLPLSSDGRATGAFRILLFGLGKFTVEMPLTRVFTPLPTAFSGMDIVATFQVDGMSPQPNSVATPWCDVLDLLRDKSAVLQDKGKEIVDSTSLIQHFTDAAAKKANLGASFRWALAVSSGGAMQYELQLLPVPPKLLVKQNLKQDNAVSVLLLDIPVTMDLFKDPLVSGPVPHLFVDDREKCRDMLQGDISGLLDDVRVMNRRFLVMEHLTLVEAVEYVTGRHRAAKGVPAFTVTGAPEPPAKRLRHSSAASSDSGTYIPA
jgi:hypothetical protein